MRFHPSPYLLLTLTALFWSGNFVLGRAVHAEIPPVSLNFWRWVAAVMVLLPFTAAATWRHRAVIAGNWRVLLVLAVTGVSVFNSFVYVALHTTTAINGSLTMAAIPVVIPVLAFAMYGERLTARQAAGIAISVAGVGIIITRAEAEVLTALRFRPGDLWMLGAVFCWSLYSVVLRRRPAALPATPFLTAISLIGVLVLAPFYAWELTTAGGFRPSPANLASIAYIGVFASVIAFIFWNRGVTELGATRAGLFSHLIPVFSAILAMVFLGESIELYHLAGMALIFTGIYLTTLAPGAWRRLVTF